MSTLAPGSGPSASVAGGPVRARTLRQRLGGPQGRNWWFLVFVAPFIIGLALFVYIPVLWSAYLSFFDARNTVTPTKFVGLANYRQLLGDQLFRDSIGTFIAFAAFIVPITFADACIGPCEAELFARRAVVLTLKERVVVEHLLDLAGQFQCRQLQQANGLLQLRREREMLRNPQRQAGFHQSRKCSPR